MSSESEVWEREEERSACPIESHLPREQLGP